MTATMSRKQERVSLEPDSLSTRDRLILRPQPEFVLPVLKRSRRSLYARFASWALLVFGLAFTVVIAIIGSKGQEISFLPLVALTVASGLFQLMSVIAGNTANRPDPNLVKTVARRLIILQGQTAGATERAQRALELVDIKDSRQELGILSVQLSQLHEHLIESLETWRDLSPDLFVQEGQNGG
jgi:hypothetical protein